MKKLAVAAITLPIVLLLASCGSSSSVPRYTPAPTVIYHGSGSQGSSVTLGQPPPATVTVQVPPAPEPAPLFGSFFGKNNAPPPPITITQQPQPAITASPPDAGAVYNGAALPADRMIVQTGQMSIVVDNVTRAIDQIAQISAQAKGYVVSSNSYRDGEKLRGSISIRVPAGDFGNIMSVIAQLAVDVTSQTSSSQDVTEEYVDLTSQLKNLQATEQQLLRIMEKADKVDDILNVEKELSTVRGQIEQTQGRMQYLEKTSATSLINVSLEQSKLGATFNADRRYINSGQTVRFYAQVGGGFTPYSYQWDFGDGKASNEASPAHAYRSAGHYTVSLTVTDDRGNATTASTPDYIYVLSGWNAGNVASGAWNGFASVGRGLASVGIWLGVFSPVWIIIGGIVVWRVRSRKKAS